MSRNELHKLTDYKRSAEQIRWLTEHGYRFEIGASGRPKVSREMVEKRLGNHAKKMAKTPRFDLVNT